MASQCISAMAGFGSSFNVPAMNIGVYERRYYHGSEETFNKYPSAIVERGLIDTIENLELDNAELRLTVANLRAENSNLRNKLMKEVEKREKREYSRDVIADFSCTEVQSMLEDIGLGNYVTAFAKELIDGSLLIEMDEQILMEELFIESPSDRQKLLRLINGEERVKASIDKRLV